MEKERKKAEKLKKFSEKKAKTSSDAVSSKVKDKPAKKESAKETPLPEYVEDTPPGEKKSEFREPLYVFVGQELIIF